MFGIATHVSEYVPIGGLCCTLIDPLRSLEDFIIHKEVASRVGIYIVSIFFFTVYIGLPMSLAAAGLAGAAMMIVVFSLLSWLFRRSRCTSKPLDVTRK